MKKIGKWDLLGTVALSAGFTLGILAVWPTELDRLKERCGYIPHPISDVAWELWDRGQVPPGTVWFYTRMMNSRNIDAAKCMRDALEPGWSNR